MTSENVKRLYLHFCKLASGNFKARDFDSITPGKNEGDEDGRMSMGKLTSERIALIQSDALVAKLELEEKYPKIKELVPQEETNEA